MAAALRSDRRLDTGQSDSFFLGWVLPLMWGESTSTPRRQTTTEIEDSAEVGFGRS